MKTRKAALAAMAAAGLAALPLTAAAADESLAALPQGSAEGYAAQVSVSLAPLTNSAAGPVINNVLGTLNTLYGDLCGPGGAAASSPGCLQGLKIPTTLPSSVSVSLAHSIASGILNKDTSDVLAGKSSSNPVRTTWDELNIDLGVIEGAIQNEVNSINALLGSQLQALNSVPGVSIPASGLLGVNALNVEGTVDAFLNQANTANKYATTANAVSVNGVAGSNLSGLDVSVDPYSAVAANSKALANATANGIPSSVTTPQVSAQNNVAHVGLPAVAVQGVTSADLSGLISQVKGLTTNLLNAIAAAQQGGLSSLTSAIQNTPLAPLTPVLNSLPTASSNTVDLAPFKSLATLLSAQVDKLTALNASLASLPDLRNVVYAGPALSSAILHQLKGGGVEAFSTSDLAAINVLPVGGSIASALQPVVSTLNLSAITDKTALLSIDGVSSSSDATIANDGSGVALGTGHLASITVLGQTLPTDILNKVLTPGVEVEVILTLPQGALSLDITQGVPNVISNTSTNRHVSMATLDIRLINGAIPCNTGANCIQLPTGSSPAGAHTAAAMGSQSTGISYLGGDGLLAEVGIGRTESLVTEGTTPQGCAVACTPPPCTSNCSPVQQSQIFPTTTSANLPATGMFGGGVLPAGLLLIAVAISLRLVPSLRSRLHRVR